MEPYWRDEKRDLSIYHGDCREVMAGFADDQFGSVIADPPYGVGKQEYLDVPPDSAILQECLRVAAGAVVMWGGARPDSLRHYVNLDPPAERVIVWAPPVLQGTCATHGMRFYWHPIHVWRPIQQTQFARDVARWMPDGCGRNAFGHPSRRPSKAMRDLCTAFGGTSVLDPYLGSGTTLAACATLGLPGVGIEISEEYCHMAASRLSDDVTYGETNLFNREEG